MGTPLLGRYNRKRGYSADRWRLRWSDSPEQLRKRRGRRCSTHHDDCWNEHNWSHYHNRNRSTDYGDIGTARTELNRRFFIQTRSRHYPRNLYLDGESQYPHIHSSIRAARRNLHTLEYSLSHRLVGRSKYTRANFSRPHSTRYHPSRNRKHPHKWRSSYYEQSDRFACSERYG